MRADILKLQEIVSELADWIVTKPLEVIQRELRMLAYDRRKLSPQNTVSLEELTHRKYIMEVADQFLQGYRKNPVQSIDQNNIFSLLAQWFSVQAEAHEKAEEETQEESQKEILKEAHEQSNKLAVIAWRHHLYRFFPQDIYPGDFIRLLVSYFNEPYKFVGFLCWLLENEVLPPEIVSSFVLHQYYDAYSFEPKIISSMYHLLRVFSENNHAVTQFMRYISDTPCGMHGLVNVKERGDASRFFSRNVMGVNFYHENPFLDLAKYKNKIVAFRVTRPIAEKADQLFFLFDWAFVGLLESHRISFAKAQDESEKERVSFIQKMYGVIFRAHDERVLRELPVVFFNAFSNLATTEIGKIYIIRGFFSAMSDTAEFQSPEYLFSLISEHLFYIHLLPFLSQSIIDVISQEYLISLWENKLSKGFYSSISHLLHLAQLCRFLSKHEKFSDVVFKMQMYIFEFLEVNYSLQDDPIAEEIIDMINMGNFAEARLDHYVEQIDRLIGQVVRGEIDYVSLEMAWGNNLPKINFVLEIEPSLKKHVVYPYSIYALRGALLQALWENAKEKALEFDFLSTGKGFLREVLAENEEVHLADRERERADIQRILLEAALFSRNEMFINEILQTVYLMNQSCDFLLHDFGEDRNLFEYAILQHNHVLLRILLFGQLTQKLRVSMKKRQKEILGRDLSAHQKTDWDLIIPQLLILAWRSRNQEAIRLIHEKKWITRVILNRVLLVCYINNYSEKTDFDDRIAMYFCTMRLFLTTVGPDYFNFIRLLKTAIRHERTHLIWMLYKLDGYCTAESVSLAFDFFSIKKNWIYLKDIVNSITQGAIPYKMRIINSACQKLFDVVLSNTTDSNQDELIEFFSIMGPIVSREMIEAGVQYATNHRQLVSLAYLCGLSGNLYQLSSVVFQNDAITYFNALKNYFVDHHSLKEKITLLTPRFLGGNTLLHHLMNQGGHPKAAEVLNEFLTHLKLILDPRSLYDFLNTTNEQGEIANTQSDQMRAIFFDVCNEARRESSLAKKKSVRHKRMRENVVIGSSSGFFVRRNQNEATTKTESDEDLDLLLGVHRTSQPGY